MVDIQIAGIDIHVQKTLQWTLFIVEMSSLNNSIHIVTKHDTNPLICIYNMCLTIYRKKERKNIQMKITNLFHYIESSL